MLDAKDARRSHLPPDGLLVSAKLAEILGAKPGDRITLEVQEGRRPTLEATIQGTDHGLRGHRRLHGNRRAAPAACAKAAPSAARISRSIMDAGRDFLTEVKEAPRIAGLGIKEAVRASFQKEHGRHDRHDARRSISPSRSSSAFGVVYNSARIALSERSRDLATLRVIGFTQREVAAVLIGELALLTLIALPVGLAIGSGIAAASSAPPAPKPCACRSCSVDAATRRRS